MIENETGEIPVDNPLKKILIEQNKIEKYYLFL